MGFMGWHVRLLLWLIDVLPEINVKVIGNIGILYDVPF